MFSNVKKCKRGMWGKLKGIATLLGWHSLENWRNFSELSGSMFEEGKQQLSAISFKPYSEKWRIFRMIFYIKRQMTAF